VSKFKKYIRLRKFTSTLKYDYLLYTSPRTFLEPLGFLTKREAIKRGKKLAEDLGIEFKEK